MSAFIHGKSNTQLFDKWNHMKARCYNKKDKRYKNYGGRGIKICEEWKQFINFYNWSIKNGYKENLEIDRMDNDGDYEPTNCQYVTRIENLESGKRNLRSDNASGFSGVYFSKSERKWISQISFNKKQIRIGCFETKEQAVLSRINKEIELFGKQRTKFQFYV